VDRGSRTRVSAVEHDALVFEVTDSGPMAGPRVVLLHGFPQRRTCWAEVSASLHSRGYRTFALDQRGYSPGARPDARTDYRWPRLVADVVALLRLTGAAHLVGHDWGALVAWATAVEHPDLVRTLVTVSAPHPRAYVRALASSTQAARSGYVVAFQVPLVPELVATLAPGTVEGWLRRSRMPEQALTRFRSEILDDGAWGPALRWYRALPLAQGLARLGDVPVPTTHVWSDGDMALTRAGAVRSGDHVRAPYRLEILRGVSHWVPDEAPSSLATIIDARARPAP